MQAAHQGKGADSPPDIDELSSRLSALATRIDTLNGGKRPQRAPAAAARQWPRVPIPSDRLVAKPDPQGRDLQGQVAVQSAELREQERRIAELTAMRDRQSQELHQAREHVERQALAIRSFRELANQHDGEIAELTRRLIQAESDKVTLESDLATALRDANNWSVRLSANEGTLTTRAADLDHAQQLIEDLRTELTAARVALSTQIAATEERLQRRYEAERSLHIDHSTRRLNEFQAHITARDGHIAGLEQDKAALNAEVEMLRAQLADSRTELQTATDSVVAKDSHIGFLDTLLKVTRDNSEATMKELAAEFDREREQYAAKERAANALQHEMVQLIPKLLERRAQAA